MTELTNYERETIILFNDDEQNATIETANRALKKRLDGFCAVDQRITLVSSNEPFKKYSLPKKWIKVNRPKVYSEETRSKMAMAARERFGNRRTDD